MCEQPRRDRGSHGGAQGEKDTFSSMKSIWVLLQISYIGRVEPRYTSAGNYNFEQYKNEETRQKISHKKCKDTFNDYQDGVHLCFIDKKKKRRLET